ncbi:MAG: NAD(P)-binding domain-containing protein, partial [Candidatus Altiarchaeota archaeon]|nr:NAD(P)-binding domain-containing protein [Candidatus Altiarchaeota archaeon]
MKKLFLEPLKTGIGRIGKKRAEICVIGVGTVGLAEAVFYAQAGFKVRGLDINPKRVEQINSHTAVFEYPEKLRKAVKSGRLTATTNPKDAIKGSDAVIVCVPTPLREDRSIDLKYVMRAASDIAANMEKGFLI